MTSASIRATAVLAATIGLATLAAGQSGDASQPCELYFKSLDALRERWRRAAALAIEGRYEDAMALRSAPLPAGLDSVWSNADKYCFEGLSRLDRQWGNESLMLIRARFFLGIGQPAMTAEACSTVGAGNFLERRELLQLHVESLVILGRYRDAVARLDELIHSSTQDSTSQSNKTWLEALRKLEGGELPLVDYLDAHTSQYSLSALFRVYDDARGLRDAKSRRLMMKLLEQRRDLTGSRLLLELSATTRSDSEDACGARVTLGNNAYERGDVAEAMNHWQRAVDEFPATRDWPKAMFNMGVALKKQKAYDRAIEVFTRLLGASVNDLEPGAHLMEEFRNYRPRASWEIGLCRLESGDAAGALRAFRTTREKHPFMSFCGNAHWEFHYQYAAFEGVCMEYLGRYKEAIGNYFEACAFSGHHDPFATRRIVDIYEQNGALQTLKRLCDEVDADTLAELRKSHPEMDLHDRDAPTAMIKLVIDIRELGRAGRYGDLADMLKDNSATGPYSPDDLQSNWPAHEAALVLARYPAQALSTLLERAKSPRVSDMGWVYYALGLNGSPEAVALLGSKLEPGQNQHVWLTLAFALSQTGARGEEILDHHDCNIASPGRRSWRESLDLHAKSSPDPWPKMPPIPMELPVPMHWDQLKAHVPSSRAASR